MSLGPQREELHGWRVQRRRRTLVRWRKRPWLLGLRFAVLAVTQAEDGERPHLERLALDELQKSAL